MGFPFVGYGSTTNAHFKTIGGMLLTLLALLGLRLESTSNTFCSVKLIKSKWLSRTGKSSGSGTKKSL